MRENKDTQSLNVHIAVENFGPIEKAEIDLRPLTVFVGESNTGKTYLATLVYVLFNTFEGFSRVPLPHSIISLLKHSRFISQKELDEETLETLKKLNICGQPFKFSDLPQWLCKHILRGFNNSEHFAGELKRCFDPASVSELIRFTGNKGNKLKVSLKVSEKNQPLWNFGMKNSGSDIAVDGNVNEDMTLHIKDERISQEILGLEDLTLLLQANRSETPDFYYLPAARGGIMETRGIISNSLIDIATPGGSEHFTKDSTFSGMIADFLKQIINYKEVRMPSREIAEIANLLEKEVLRGEVEVKSPAGGFPEFLYHPRGAEQGLRMSQSSSMVSELAPLVLFLRGVVKPRDTLIIEEPEAHLHPRAQTKIAITLARLVRAGVRVIITTHSDWLLQQIGNLIREGELNKQEQDTSELPHWLSKEEVGAWWFHTDKPVKEIPYDRIEGIEPRDYEEVADGLYNNFVELERQFLNEKAESENE